MTESALIVKAVSRAHDAVRTLPVDDGRHVDGRGFGDAQLRRDARRWRLCGASRHGEPALRSGRHPDRQDHDPRNRDQPETFEKTSEPRTKTTAVNVIDAAAQGALAGLATGRLRGRVADRVRRPDRARERIDRNDWRMVQRRGPELAEDTRLCARTTGLAARRSVARCEPSWCGVLA